MDKSISLSIHLFILGVLICLTTAVSLRHKRNVIAEYKWPEPDPNTDQFPHETSCHHYYLVISEEDITINKCPHGELFDYVEHKCKDKETARCWIRHFGKTKHHHIPLKSMGPFTCPYAWGKYPDNNDCTKYYTCLSGKVKHKKCAPYEHFDKISRKCVAAITGVCADKTDVVERDFKCPRNWGSFSFHKDCSKYYECLERQPNLRTCPNDTLFHEKRGKCVPKNHVHCGSRHNPYSKKDVTSSTTTTTITPSENLRTISSEFRIESETTSDVKIPSKAEINRDVQSGDRVSQTTQLPKDSTTVEIAPSVFDSTSNEPSVFYSTSNEPSVFDSTSNEPSVESGTKSDVNISSEGDVNAEGKPIVVKVAQTSQTQNNLTSDTSNSGNNLTAKSDFVDSSTKGPASDETKSLVEHNTFKNNPVNDIDDITDSKEFIEVSTDSKSSISTTSQTIAVESSQKIEEGSTHDKEDHKTTLESSQASTLDDSDECSPKDPTCVSEEGGRIIRCPQADGIFPYPGDERRFLQCKQREIRVKFCPGHLIYNHSQKKCISKMIF